MENPVLITTIVCTFLVHIGVYYVRNTQPVAFVLHIYQTCFIQSVCSGVCFGDCGLWHVCVEANLGPPPQKNKQNRWGVNDEQHALAMFVLSLLEFDSIDNLTKLC